MKTKLFGKITLFAFALMVTMSFGFMSPMLMNSLYGATSIVQDGQGHIIELTNYTSSYEYGQEQEFETTNGTVKGYQIPTPTAKTTSGTTPDGTGVSVDVRTSAGKIITVQQSNDKELFIQVNKSGVYHVTYSIKNGNVTTATRDIDITITTKEANFEFAENSAQIIPTTAVVGDKITFPIPSIMQGDEEMEGVTFDVGDIALNGNEVKKVTARTLSTETKDGVKYATYTVVDGDYGLFTVTYKSNVNGNDIFKKFTFNVVKNAPEVELKYSSFSSSLENLTLSVGKEVTFPTPTVVNSKASDAVVNDVYTVITVKNKTTGKTETVTDFKFTPSEDGDYVITYKTTDLNGKHSITTEINKNGVKKTGDSIQLKVVDAYSLDDVATMKEGFADLTTVEHDIPSLVYKVKGTDKEVTFPAVFAIGGWGNYSNLKITRSIYKNNSFQRTLDTPANEKATYTFKSAGDYSIRYEAQYVDADGNVISGTTKQLSAFTFVVEESEAEITEDDLTITAPTTMPKTVRKGDTITFSAPTVTDYKKDTSEIADKNVKVEVLYKFVGNTSSESYNATKNSDGTYSIKIEKPTSFADWDNVTNVSITFKATNDLGQTEEATATVNIVDYSNDKVAPTMTTPVAGTAVDGKIALSTVQFTDTETAMRVVAYVIKDGKVVKTFNGKTGLDVTLQNLVYEPSEAGDYTVTYIATDQNNNTTTYSELYTVEFNDGANVSISNIAQEYGAKINLLDYIQLTKNGKSVDMSTITVSTTDEEVTQSTLDALANNTLLIQVTGDYTTPAFNRLEGEIIALEGNIEVRAWVKVDSICDFDKNSSAKLSFATSDSTAPTFTIEDESFGSLPYEKDVRKIELPWFENITDNAEIDKSTMKITLTYQDSTKAVAEFTYEDYETAQEAGKVLEFVPPFATNSTTNSKEGKVDVVYSVKDIHGLEATRTFVLSIGDVNAPEIVVSNDAITAPTKVSTDGKISIDLSKISIVDSETLSSEDLTVVVKRDGTTLTTSTDDGIITVDAKEAGSYVITFDIKDSAGNSALTVTKTFTVSKETVTTTNTTTIWGTVLIVVSLVVLGVVIFFFVKPSKGKNTMTISNKKQKDDKEDK